MPGVHLVFPFAQTMQPEVYNTLLIIRYTGQQERNLKNKKDLKRKFYKHNIIGDVALTNISRETNCHPWFCGVFKTKVLRISSASVCS